nr:ABC transporter permease [Starkeya sp. ORNL1]
MRRHRRAFDWISRVQGPLIGLLVLCLLFACVSPVFLSVRNALNILDQVTVLGILAIGMTGVIIIGGIDLSVGALLAVATMTMGAVWRDFEAPFGVCIILGLLAGSLGGLVNGLLITRAKLPPFIATLTTMSVARGIANITTNGAQVVGFPDWFTSLATVRHFGFLSVTVGLFIVLAICGFMYLRFRATGRMLYAIGGNAEVAHLAGIRVQPLTLMVYVASGLLSAIAGVALSARLDSAQPSDGFGYELDTIAAVVIGGASLSGGVGSIGGTVVGVLIIGVLHNGLNLVGVSPFVQQVFIGIAIAIAVAMDRFKRQEA